MPRTAFPFARHPVEGVPHGAPLTIGPTPNNKGRGNGYSGPDADTGFVFAGTAANMDGGSPPTWSIGLTNIGADDDTLVQTDDINGSGLTDYLYAYNFNFTIPAGARIKGIEVVIETWQSKLGSPLFNDIQLVIGGSRTGNDLANSEAWGTTTPVTRTYGGATNLWGATPSRADVLDSSFGFALRGTYSAIGLGKLQVDYVKAKIYYGA